MSVYEKARELGEMILETKEGKRMYDAEFVYSQDKQAQSVFKEYMSKRNVLIERAEEIGEENLKQEIKKLNDMEKEIRKNEVLAELLESREDFSRLVNSVLGILKETVLKDEGGCNGKCSSCKGCG